MPEGGGLVYQSMYVECPWQKQGCFKLCWTLTQCPHNKSPLYLPWLFLSYVFDENLRHHNYTKRQVYVMTWLDNLTFLVYFE